MLPEERKIEKKAEQINIDVFFNFNSSYHKDIKYTLHQ